MGKWELERATIPLPTPVLQIGSYDNFRIALAGGHKSQACRALTIINLIERYRI